MYRSENHFRGNDLMYSRAAWVEEGGVGPGTVRTTASVRLNHNIHYFTFICLARLNV